MNNLKTISYSSLINYKNCPHFFKLVNVEKIRKFENNPKTIQGTLVHQGVQNILFNLKTEEETINRFKRTWKIFYRLYRKYIDLEKYDMKEMGQATVKVFKNIKKEFQNKFGNYKVLYVEEKLQESLDDYPQNFKGFIDIVIELEDKTIVIIDFKSCDSAFFFKKYRDKYKDYQLTLYKNFLSKKYKIDFNKIKTYFVLLERKTKTRSLISFEEVGSSKIKISNALSWVNKSLKGINNNIFYKNRSFCKMYGKNCCFWNTNKCKLTK
jgi:hypothetical protein